MGLFHRDLRRQVQDIVDSLSSAAVRIPENWQWMEKREHLLHEIDEEDVKLMAGLKELHRMGLDTPLARLIFVKAKQLHEYIRWMLATKPQLDPEKHSPQIERFNRLIREIGDIYRKEIGGEKAYERFIVSTPEVVRFLHRTSVDDAEKIIQVGLGGSGGALLDLYGTATVQPRDLNEARKLFVAQHKSDNAVVIIEFPMWLFMEASRTGRKSEFHMDPRISYNSAFSLYTIRPEYIVGYIDRKDNSVHLNPRYLKRR